MLSIEPEDGPYPCGFFVVDDQLVGDRVDVVAQDRSATRPFAFLAGGGDLVPGALADDLAFKLGEGEQDVERQPCPWNVVVLNCCVTLTNEIPCWSNTSIMLGEVEEDAAESDRLCRRPRSRSGPLRCQLSSCLRAGRSMLPPVKPPSSYLSGRQTQPSWAWLLMKASADSRWASRLLNSCSRPSSVLLRV